LLILLTNDDGITAPGLRALVEAMQALGDVVVVAPDRERSAVSHALTLHSPLRVWEHADDWYAVDGTPTDCVNLGLHGLFSDKPQIVVSGINRGGNMGDDITYSGTVSAAMEATLMGVPALAVSLDGDGRTIDDYRVAADYARTIAERTLETGLPPDTFLNINVPPRSAEELCGICLTRQGKRVYSDLVERKLDPRGKDYYWLGGGEIGFENIPGTDFHAVAHHYVSVTPLHLDLTNYGAFSVLKQNGYSTSQDLGIDP